MNFRSANRPLTQLRGPPRHKCQTPCEAKEKGSPWRAFLSHDSNSFLIDKEHLVQLDSIRAKAAADLQTEILHILRCFFIELQNT